MFLIRLALLGLLQVPVLDSVVDCVVAAVQEVLALQAPALQVGKALKVGLEGRILRTQLAQMLGVEVRQVLRAATAVTALMA